MNVTYASTWSIPQKRPLEIWDETRAKTAHTKHHPYTVLVDGASSPTKVIEVRKDFVAVAFLDEFLRQYMMYNFDEMSDGRLFLRMVLKHEFDGSSDQITVSSAYIFSEVGNLSVKQEIAALETMEAAEGRADVTGNWEPFPTFGDYESLSREDRELYLPDLHDSAE